MVIKSRNPDKDAKITLLVGLVLAVIWIVSMFLPLFFYKDEARADPTGPGPYIIWRNANNWWDMEDGILKVPKIITDSIEGQLVDPILILAIDPTGPDTFVVEGDNANKAINVNITNVGGQTGEGAHWVQNDWMLAVADTDSVQYSSGTVAITDSLPLVSSEVILRNLHIQSKTDEDWIIRFFQLSIGALQGIHAHCVKTVVCTSLVSMGATWYDESADLGDAVYVNEQGGGSNWLYYKISAAGATGGYLHLRVGYLRGDVP
jgi:hypothetical protein